MSSDPGKYSTDISASVIEAALQAVKRAPESEAPAAFEGEGMGVEIDVAPNANAKDLAQEVASLTAQLEFSQAKSRDLMEKLREEHDRALRAAADLENYRKRALKEKDEVARFGIEKLLRDFLPVADNLDRALEHAQSNHDGVSLQRGVEMTRKLFDDSLAKHGVKSFTAVGQPFDPRLHEAMNQVERADLPPNSVVSEMVRGYTLNDRLVRPALVTVTKAPAKPVAASGGEPETHE